MRSELLERSVDGRSKLIYYSWWKAKLKDADGDEEGGVGLIPVSYVEEVGYISSNCR